MTKKLSDKEQAFLDALFGEAKGNPHLAKKMAGYSENTKTRQIVNALSDEIAAGTREFIAQSAPEAIASIVGILGDPTALGNKDKLAAAKDILDRGGFKEADKLEVKTDGPLFILPAKGQLDEIEDSDG